MVTEGGHHAQVSFPAPSVTKITIGMASSLIFQPLLVANSIPAFPHIAGDAMQAKSLSEIILNQRVGVFEMTSTPSLGILQQERILNYIIITLSYCRL